MIDNGWTKYGISAEILSILYENKDINLKDTTNKNWISKDTPIPSSRELAKYCYPYCKDIIKKILKIFKRNDKINIQNEFIDVPDQKIF